MSKAFTKHFKIKTNNLKISIEDFIQKLEKQNDEFGIFKITHNVIFNKKEKPVAIMITLVSQHYLFPLWNLCRFFMENVEIGKDISELEV